MRADNLCEGSNRKTVRVFLRTLLGRNRKESIGTGKILLKKSKESSNGVWRLRLLLQSELGSENMLRDLSDIFHELTGIHLPT